MRRKLALAGVGVAVVAAIVFWPSKGDEPAQREGAAGGDLGVADAGERRGRAARDKARRMVSPVAAAPPATSGPRMGRMFKGLCADTSPIDRCEQGQPLADQCEAGDAAACVAVAELFFTVPVQPHFAVVYLGRACKLGDASACERQRRQRVWMKWPEGKLAGDPSPAEACDTGDPIACYHDTFLPGLHDKPIDVARAWKACEAGIADSCGTAAYQSSDAATVVRAMEMACRSRSPLHCGLLVSMFDDGLVCCEEPLAPLDERGGCIPCPEFDRGRASGYAAQVLELTGKPYDPRYEDEDSEDE